MVILERQVNKDLQVYSVKEDLQEKTEKLAPPVHPAHQAPQETEESRGHQA